LAAIRAASARAVECSARRGQGADETQPVRVGGGQRVPGKREFHGDAGRDAAGQPDRPARGGDQAALDLWKAEFGLAARLSLILAPSLDRLGSGSGSKQSNGSPINR
jgi:hypothetical protein